MGLSTEQADAARAVLIAGPTASGKSGLALDLAARLGREALIVNADSMQVYRELRVLTARPSAAEIAAVPHALYGHVGAAERYSVGRWLGDAAGVLADCRARGALPVFVGGTGLYFKALTEGLVETPEIPEHIRRHWAAELAERGAEALHRALAGRDPEGASALRPADGQRIVRALEVLEASGRPLRELVRERATPPLLDAADARRILLRPDRGALYERIDRRFDGMIAAGALEEVRALLDARLDPRLPAMKAIGVRELARHLAGEAGLEEAVLRAKTATRRYAKRQMTWFRHRMHGWDTHVGSGC